jgi:GH15 family glucan-1,4-alpha-glucosidase
MGNRSGYSPIESYGIIGDLRSVALISKEGSLDWCCLPRFDSPSVFGAILDSEKGGHFQIRAQHESNCVQMYLPDTNVLVTRFLSVDGVGEVVDFMPVATQSGGPTPQAGGQIIRTARAVRHAIPFRLELFPAFDYGRAPHRIELCSRGAVVECDRQAFVLSSDVPLRSEGGRLTAEFVLQAGETATFALRHLNGGECRELLDQPVDGELLLRDTVRFWRGWMAHSRYKGRWREMVNRSALVLKLLTYQPTGAVVAAATTSLPEEMGGVRNWDYRYSWVRDAAFTVYALMRLGYTEEAAAFTNFIQARAREQEPVDGPLNVMYGIDGRHDLPEEILDHWEGYRGSRPVRIGNGAAAHLQLDIYGELMDSVYLYDKYGSPLSYDMWQGVESLLDWVSNNWERPDQSIWEVRGGRQQFTYSKLQCWVALDRGLRLGTKRSFPMNGARWLQERDRLYRAIMSESWNEQLQSFVQYYGADAVDASLLMMPLMLFISPTDPRMLSTIAQIKKQLVSDSLVHRYDVGRAAGDGLPGEEGTFSICTFWLVEALTRAGYLEEAQFIFEKMLTYANHLGLYAEEIGPAGEALGNFPQAFTHLGLISAAFNLDRQLGGH